MLLLSTGTHFDLEDGTNIVAWLSGALELNEDEDIAVDSLAHTARQYQK